MAASESGRRRNAVAVAAGIVIVAVVLAAGFFGLRAAWRSLSAASDDGCHFSSFVTDPDQASTAATMVGVVTRRGLPERAAVLVLGAALQESKLRNIPAGQGDRDSIGVLQQRPSQGWGTPAELADVDYATGAFLDKMVKIRSWRTRALSTVVQAVQISADGNAYAQHEPEAQAIADAFTGRAQRGITCTFSKPKTPETLTAMATRLGHELPVNPPVIGSSAITVTGASWPTAAWFVANAERGGIETIAYDGWRWTRTNGWRPRAGTSAAAVVAAT